MPKRNRPREKNQPKKSSNQRWYIIGVISIAAIIIAAILIIPNLPKSETAVLPTAVFKAVPNPNGLSMGSANAPVKVEEYSDFQCPYCKQFFTDFEAGVIDNYVAKDKVLFTYNPFSFIGAESKLAAEAAFCAADQNKFWEIQTQIFSAQGTENSGIFTNASLKNFAKAAGVDQAKFNSCFDAGTYKTKVDDFNTQATQRGVKSTPSFFVNGKGPLNSNEVTAEIDKALAGK